MANYAGPGTDVIGRLRLGIKPVNTADKAAQRHDLDYTRAKNIKDIRKADE